jgi:hypothetical protein
VAGRHGLPVGSALAGIAERYRRSQQPDGTWAYALPNDRTPAPPADDERALTSRASMTCAAVMGLAIAAADAAEPDKVRADIVKDPRVRAGLMALGTTVGQPVGDRNRILPIPRIGGRTYYFLWSLERLCVALDIKTMGGKDWYAWGAGLLLANQKDDGSWRGDHEAYYADTCFALLFLRRANLARDLTARARGRARGLGGAVLRAGPARPDRGDAPAGDRTHVADSGKQVAPSGAARLADELVRATSPDPDGVLQKLREGKGVEYTEALTAAIGRLRGPTREKARQALEHRLARMSADTLGRYLRDDEAEIRRAAAVACGVRDLKGHVPHLIPLLRDPNGTVAAAAESALRDLTGQKLGRDAAAWQAWWERHGKD